jgi:hypothetical protein
MPPVHHKSHTKWPAIEPGRRGGKPATNTVGNVYGEATVYPMHLSEDYMVSLPRQSQSKTLKMDRVQKATVPTSRVASGTSVVPLVLSLARDKQIYCATWLPWSHEDGN